MSWQVYVGVREEKDPDNTEPTELMYGLGPNHGRLVFDTALEAVEFAWDIVKQHRKDK